MEVSFEKIIKRIIAVSVVFMRTDLYILLSLRVVELCLHHYM